MIYAGFGFREAAQLECFIELIERLKKVYCMDAQLSAIATIAQKAATPVFKELSDQTSLAIVALNPDDIIHQKTQSFSQDVMELYGTGSMAEASALAAATLAKPDYKAQLMGPRVVSKQRMVTCAFARGGQR